MSKYKLIKGEDSFQIEKDGKVLPLDLQPTNEKALDSLKESLNDKNFAIDASGEPSTINWEKNFPINSNFKNGAYVGLSDLKQVI